MLKSLIKCSVILLICFVINFNLSLFAASTTIKKDISTKASDGFQIKANLEYPKVKGKKNFSTVVLLHSIGYDSDWWGDLPSKLLADGYAVLKIDLRGHGASVYNSKLVRTSWKNFTNSAFTKYPDDFIKVLEEVKAENSKKVFFDNWAIVGADIGANTAVLAAEKVSYKPKTIVMLSPTVDIKGMYIPIKLANLDHTDFLCISGDGDSASYNAQVYLKRFAQSNFKTYLSDSKSSGMLLIKNDNTVSTIITKWIEEYLN